MENFPQFMIQYWNSIYSKHTQPSKCSVFIRAVSVNSTVLHNWRISQTTLKQRLNLNHRWLYSLGVRASGSEKLFTSQHDSAKPLSQECYCDSASSRLRAAGNRSSWTAANWPYEHPCASYIIDSIICDIFKILYYDISQNCTIQ